MPEDMNIYKNPEGEQVQRRKVLDPNGEEYYEDVIEMDSPRPTPEPVTQEPRVMKGRDQIQIICPESGSVMIVDVEESIDGEVIVSLRNPSHSYGPQVTADVHTCHDEPYSEEKFGPAPPELATEGVCVGGAIEVPYMMKGTGAMTSSTVLPIYVSQAVFDDVLMQIYKALEKGVDDAALDFHRAKHQNLSDTNPQYAQSFMTDANGITHEIYHQIGGLNNEAPEQPALEEENKVDTQSPEFSNTDEGFQK